VTILKKRTVVSTKNRQTYCSDYLKSTTYFFKNQFKIFNIMKKIINSLNTKAFAFMFIFSFIAFAGNAQKSTLRKGETLGINEKMTSLDGQYEFFGGLKLFKKGDPNAVWEFPELPNGAKQLTIDEAGSLVVSDDKGKTVWSSASKSPNVGELRLQNDGNLVLYDATGNDQIWALQDPKTNKYESGGNGFCIKPKIQIFNGRFVPKKENSEDDQ
jgi:hypothetical protein